MLMVVLAFSFVGCSDDDDASPSKTEMISKKWIYDEVSIMPFGTIYKRGASKNLSDFSSDYAEFKSDGTYTFVSIDEGETETEIGTWTFLNNESQLSLTSEGETVIGNIIKLSASELEYSYTDPEEGLTATAKMIPQ